jgi:hypothetical protein
LTGEVYQLTVSNNTKSEPEFTVLDPRGQQTSTAYTPLAPRLKDLNNKTIYIIDSFATSEKNASGLENMFHKIIPEGLKKRFPSVNIVFKERNTGHLDDDPVLMKDIKENNVAAYIYGTTTATTLVSQAFTWVINNCEKKDLPGLVLLFDALESVARFSQENYGCPVRYTAVPYPETAMKSDQISRAIDSIVFNLTAPLTSEETKTGTCTPPRYSRMLTTGSLDTIQKYFYDQGMTDGLPVIPPTEQKVAAMLRHTGHKPDEVLAKVFPPWNLEEVTVEKAAINGIMAGCDPEYMPVLLALIEAYLKAGGGALSTSTNSFTFMLVINGPIRRQLKMNTGYGALGGMNKANAAIGRALKLFIINLGGGKMGINMMPVIGNVANSTFCFPENEEESPWSSFSVDQGFTPEDSTLTFFSQGWAHTGNYGFGGFIEVAKDMAQFEYPSGATILMSPGRINYIKDSSGNVTMTKEEIKKYLWEHTVLPLKEYKSNHYFNALIGPRLASGEVKPEDLNQPDDTPFRVYGRNSIWIIVVGGGAAPMMQAWQIGRPNIVSIDKWR